MKKIRNLILKIMSFLNSKNIMRYLISIMFCLVVLFLFGMFTDDTFSNILSIFFGFIISQLVLNIFTIISAKLEDPAKVSDNIDYLLKIYKNPNCKKVVELNNTKTTILYKDLMVNNKNYNIKIIDNPDSVFEVDDFIGDNFHTLMSAHRYSKIKNAKTVRLKSCKQTNNNEYTLELERSTYFNHLITNRVADFKLESGISLRDYYEYGPDISAPEESKMSNHIGIIALIYLKNGELLLPRRKGNSTISKNKITSSIAMMLKPPKDNNVSQEYLLKQCIIDGIVDRVHMEKEFLVGTNFTIEFLGCGQEILELGKPHLFYKVVLNDIDRHQYISHLLNNFNDSDIDKDKLIYTVKKDTLKFKNDKIIFQHYKCKYKNGKIYQKLKKASATYENAFACNIWHENQVLTNKE